MADAIFRARNHIVKTFSPADLQISNKQKQSYDIFWNNPEAFVYNETKKTLNLDEEKLNVTTRIIPDS